MGVAVERELTCHAFRQSLECSLVGLAEVCEDVLALCLLVQILVVGTVSGEQVVEFLNKATDSGYELNESLGDEHHTEVVALACAVGHSLSYLLHNLIEGEVFLLYLLRDEADVGLCLQCALKCDVRGRAAHQLDEVPVLACRVAVALYVADNLSIGLAGSIETERCLNLVVLQVAVYGLGTADDLYAVVLCSIILSQHTGVGVGVVTTDDYHGVDAKLTDDFQSLLKLVYLLKFRTARAYHVAVVLEEVLGYLDILMVNKSTRTHEETVKTVCGIQLLYLVKKSGDNVMTARSLAAAEDYTHIDGLAELLLTGYELHQRHAVGVGE